jgi:hypothetical protein
MYKKYFCSFADSRMWRSLDRIKKQAKAMQIYDNIFVCDEKNLDLNFQEHFKDKLVPSRGFGYWVWRPQIILQILDKMNDGDILQYTDAGCHLNKKGIKRLNEYFEMANTSQTGILAFQSKEPEDKNLEKALYLPERYWTKGDVFDYFGVRELKEFTETEQMAGGIIFIKKTDQSLRIFQEFLQVGYDDFSLFDDTPSKSPNLDGFIENRHDQSIFSILVKKYKLPTVSSYEHWQLDFNFKKLKYYPIWAIRDIDLDGNFYRKVRIFFKNVSFISDVYYAIKRVRYNLFGYEIERYTKTAKGNRK